MLLSNKITLGRLGLTFIMVGFLTSALPYSKTAALLTFALAGLSDWLDGFFARRRQQISAFGQLMDPLADKILVSAAFVSFVAVHQVPAWIVITIISREFLITGLRLLAVQRGTVLPAGRWGKHKMIWQTIAIVTIMLGLALQQDLLPLWLGATHVAFVNTFNTWFAYVSLSLSLIVGALTVISGVIYLWESQNLYMEQS